MSCQNVEANNNLKINGTNSLSESNFTTSKSRIYNSENFPEPRNATEEELEAFHSKSYGFQIPFDVDDFEKSRNNISNIMSNLLRYMGI
uniref:Uncharacterized protein n=1 Tax=Rhizophagus irregularis (strain DAOM 181602 / DAOM 197198 / MUCL 43194) TaxID=747089 RepID=U9TXT3_RHIID